MNLAHAPICRGELGHVQDPSAKRMSLRRGTKPGPNGVSRISALGVEHGAGRPGHERASCRIRTSWPESDRNINSDGSYVREFAEFGLTRREPDPRQVRRRREQARPNRPWFRRRQRPSRANATRHSSVTDRSVP